MMIVMRMLVVLFLLFIVISTISFISLDPDFGWHLTMGNLILTKGIPTHDPFSYTMPSYTFIDHEWLANVFMAWLYGMGGKLLSTIVFSLFVIGALALCLLRVTKVTFSSFVLLFLATVGILPFTGVRPQEITWMLFSGFLVVLLDDKYWQKWKWLLPPLLLFWVNIHGGFGVGVVSVFLAVSIRTWVEKKLNWENLCVLFLCVFVTFFNPYGVRIWYEVWMQLSDSKLHWSIGEWAPLLIYFNTVLFLFMVLSFAFFLKFRKQYSLLEQVFYIVFLLAALSSARHAPLFVFVSLPLTIRGVGYLRKEAYSLPHGKKRFLLVSRLFLGLAGVCLLVQTDIQYYTTKTLVESSFYPKKALQYLYTHPTKGNMFSDYNWGGYLIWQYPGKKVFADGRMPSWRRSSAPQGESSYAFVDYQKTLDGTIPFIKTAQKYSIDTVLLPPYKTVEQNIIDAYVQKLIDSFEHKKKTKKYL